MADEQRKKLSDVAMEYVPGLRRDEAGATPASVGDSALTAPSLSDGLLAGVNAEGRQWQEVKESAENPTVTVTGVTVNPFYREGQP